MAVRDSGAKLLMTDYERPEGGVPYDDAVLNWVVYSHDEMGYKAGEWLADEFRSSGNFEPRIRRIMGAGGVRDLEGARRWRASCAWRGNGY